MLACLVSRKPWLFNILTWFQYFQFKSNHLQDPFEGLGRRVPVPVVLLTFALLRLQSGKAPSRRVMAAFFRPKSFARVVFYCVFWLVGGLVRWLVGWFVGWLVGSLVRLWLYGPKHPTCAVWVALTLCKLFTLAFANRNLRFR